VANSNFNQVTALAGDSDVIRFFCGGKGSKAKSLDWWLRQPDRDLVDSYGWINWWFPSKVQGMEGKKDNAKPPLLTAADIKAFKRQAVGERFLAAVERFAQYLGFTYRAPPPNSTSPPKIQRDEEVFPKQDPKSWPTKRLWVCPGQHVDHGRIARAIQSIGELNQKHLAKEIYDAVMEISDGAPKANAPSEETRELWLQALEGIENPKPPKMASAKKRQKTPIKIGGDMRKSKRAKPMNGNESKSPTAEYSRRHGKTQPNPRSSPIPEKNEWSMDDTGYSLYPKTGKRALKAQLSAISERGISMDTDGNEMKLDADDDMDPDEECEDGEGLVSDNPSVGSHVGCCCNTPERKTKEHTTDNDDSSSDSSSNTTDYDSYRPRWEQWPMGDFIDPQSPSDGSMYTESEDGGITMSEWYAIKWARQKKAKELIANIKDIEEAEIAIAEASPENPATVADGVKAGFDTIGEDPAILRYKEDTVVERHSSPVRKPGKQPRVNFASGSIEHGTDRTADKDPECSVKVCTMVAGPIGRGYRRGTEAVCTAAI
jgi:hypothetical protein